MNRQHKLFDKIKADNNLKSDCAFAAKAGITPSQVCKIRAGTVNASASVLLRLHEVFDIPFAEMRELLKADAE